MSFELNLWNKDSVHICFYSISNVSANTLALIFRLTAEVIRKAEHKLQPVIQGFLASVIEGKITGTELRDVYHLLIYQVKSMSLTEDNFCI